MSAKPREFIELVFEKVKVGNALSSADFAKIAGSYNQLVSANENLRLTLADLREAFALNAEAKLLARDAFEQACKERDRLKAALEAIANTRWLPQKIAREALSSMPEFKVATNPSDSEIAGERE